MNSDHHFTIGFANLDDKIPFCITVRQSLEMAAARHPGLRVITRDNDLNDDRAMENVEYFASVPVDLAIIFHINERIGPRLARTLHARRIPIIAVDVPIATATYFGVDNHGTGELLGNMLVDWINLHWDGRIDRLLALTETRVMETVRARIQSGVETITRRTGFKMQDALFMDSGHERTLTVNQSTEIFQRWADAQRIVCLGFSEASTLGLIDAARQLQIQSRVIIAGQSGNEESLVEIRRPDSPLVAFTSFRPENYGPGLVELAIRILNKERVPMQNYTSVELISRENTGQA